MVFCQQSGDILWPRTMFYSTTSWLMLFVYQYNYFGHTKIEIDINQIHCSSLQVNLCEMSGTFLQQVAQVSNFTFRFSGEQVSRKHLHFSVPEDECGILQIVSGGHDCTVHFRPEPIVYGESYNRTRSMFYLVTGASKVISDVYRYGNYHHTLYFEGHWEHHKQNAKGKISSSSSSFSPIEENIRSPHYFYHVHFEFNLKVQQNIFDRSYFNFKSISAQWSKFWFTVVFWNYSSCSKDPRSYGHLYCVRNVLGSSNQLPDPFRERIQPHGYQVKNISTLEDTHLGVKCEAPTFRMKLNITSTVLSRFKAQNIDEKKYPSFCQNGCPWRSEKSYHNGCQSALEKHSCVFPCSPHGFSARQNNECVGTPWQ